MTTYEVPWNLSRGQREAWWSHAQLLGSHSLSAQPGVIFPLGLESRQRALDWTQAQALSTCELSLSWALISPDAGLNLNEASLFLQAKLPGSRPQSRTHQAQALLLTT